MLSLRRFKVGRLEAKAREDGIKYETNENDMVINSSEITISNIDRDSRYGEGVINIFCIYKMLFLE